MEKKRLNFFILVKLTFTAIFLSINFSTHAQKLETFKNYCGGFYKSMADLQKMQQKEISFYDFRSGQTIASIGAQCCHWEAAYAATTDSVTFYLEDIDSSKFKKGQVEFAWNYYASLRGRPMTSDYKMIIGDERSTSLPENTFDKILVINSFHEFTFQAEMLADIKKKLKPNGILYIDEALPKKQGQLHGICNKPMLTNEETIAIFEKKGFKYVDGIDFNYRQKKPVRKIFAFKIKE
ncbi:MAG TPA: methyltransferase domain-containing protein [Chitinophagaceae bacterium]